MAFISQKAKGPLTDRILAGLAATDPKAGAQNDAELAIISGGILFDLLGSTGINGIAAALAISTTSFGGHSKIARLTEVMNEAENHLLVEALRVRESAIELPDLAKLIASNPTLSNGLRKATAENEEEEAEETVDASDLLHEFRKILTQYGFGAQQAATIMEKRRKEDTSILYWLLSGGRRSSAEPCSDSKRQGVVLRIAFDLAEQTEQLPGPPASSTIFESLLGQCKDTEAAISMKTCIGGIRPEDGEQYLTGVSACHPQIMPITFGLEKAREHAWKKGWATAFEVQTHLHLAEKIPYVTIAEQFYRERLLGKALAGDSDHARA